MVPPGLFWALGGEPAGPLEASEVSALAQFEESVLQLEASHEVFQHSIDFILERLHSRTPDFRF